MSEKNNGGPAFPTTGDPMAQAQAVGCGGRYLPPQGMTMRDYFAAKAMQGLLATGATYGGKTDNRDALAADAFATADAMIKARDA